jgi:hypothetical protein
MFERELQEIGNKISELIKAEIRRQALIDSGALIDSIFCRVSITPDGFTFSIEAEDYYKYLDADYSITSNVLNSSEFNEVQTQIANVYSLIILEELNKTN